MDSNVLDQKLELVSKELNHLAAILHVCAGGLIFMMKKCESTPRTLTLHLVIDTTYLFPFYYVGPKNS